MQPYIPFYFHANFDHEVTIQYKKCGEVYNLTAGMYEYLFVYKLICHFNEYSIDKLRKRF